MLRVGLSEVLRDRAACQTSFCRLGADSRNRSNRTILMIASGYRNPAQQKVTGVRRGPTVNRRQVRDDPVKRLNQDRRLARGEASECLAERFAEDVPQQR